MLAKVIRYDCLERTNLLPGGNDHNVVGVLVVAAVLQEAGDAYSRARTRSQGEHCSSSTTNKVNTYTV